jgi:nucleotide-binding universal stress UspA family protein
MFKKILVAFDGSEHAVKALKMAIDLCKKYGASLSVATAVNLPELPDNEGHGGDLERAAQMARQEGVAVVTHLLRGSTASTLQRFAEDNQFDLVLVGARGRNAVQRLLMGSVSYHLVVNLQCPVMVVKEKSA